MLVTKHKRLISGDPSRWFSATVGRMRLADSRSSRLEASDRVCDKPLLAFWAESFIFAGSSAILLLIANLFSSCWYFSFFALAPFLYRIIKAAPIESLRLGSLLGLSFFGALWLVSGAGASSIWIQPIHRSRTLGGGRVGIAQTRFRQWDFWKRGAFPLVPARTGWSFRFSGRVSYYCSSQFAIGSGNCQNSRS